MYVYRVCVYMYVQVYIHGTLFVLTSVLMEFGVQIGIHIMLVLMLRFH